MTLLVRAPVPGVVTALAQVPDPVFAEAMVGPGLAIAPDDEATSAEVRAPVAGTVAKLHPHAVLILAAEGHGVLVHIGIDTVRLRGEGFDLHVAEGTAVSPGQLLVSFSPARIVAEGFSPITPVVALDAAAEALTSLAEPGEDVLSGQDLFAWE